MSVLKSLKVLVAATALAAFLAPTLPVGEAFAAATNKAAAVKKTDKKDAKSVKTASKKVQKKDQKDVKKAPAKKVAKKKTPAKKQTV